MASWVILYRVCTVCGCVGVGVSVWVCRCGYVSVCCSGGVENIPCCARGDPNKKVRKAAAPCCYDDNAMA